MPSAPPKICQCGRRVPDGERCPCRVRAHAQTRKAYDAKRPSAAARGYDADWRDVRSQHLKAHPFCCEPGCNALATEVDHILTVRNQPGLRLSRLNLRSFCKSHHSARTARDRHAATRGAGLNLAQEGQDRTGPTTRKNLEKENCPAPEIGEVR